MKKSKSDKFSSFFALAFLAVAGIIAFAYVNEISADVENQTTVSSKKESDFSTVSDFSKSSWTAFSNLGDAIAKISDKKLAVVNYGTIYSTTLSQPVTFTLGEKYRISISYEIKEGDNLEVKYGVVTENLIGKPDFTSLLDPDTNEVSFEYEPKDISPISFQYFRLLGSGELDLKKITIEEEISSSSTPQSALESATPTPAPTQTQTIIETTTATAEIAKTGISYEIKPGWNLFGTDQPVDSRSFTNLGLSVYTANNNGWKIAQRKDSGSDYSILPGTGAYIYNGSEDTIDAELLEGDDASLPSLTKGWNILYTSRAKSTSDIEISLNNDQISLEKLVEDGTISKYAYLSQSDNPSELVKTNLQKYTSVDSGKIIWVYLF